MGDGIDGLGYITTAERCAFASSIRKRDRAIFDRPAMWPSSAVQRFWKTATTFHECPEVVRPDGIWEYAERLTPGLLANSNLYGESYIIRAELLPGDVLAMLCTLPEPHVGPVAALAFVYVERERFVHQSHGMYWNPATCFRDLDSILGRRVEFIPTRDDEMRHVR